MALEIALLIVGILIVIVAAVSGGVGLWLTIKYFRYNRRENSLGLTGIQIARKILDEGNYNVSRVIARPYKIIDGKPTRISKDRSTVSYCFRSNTGLTSLSKASWDT